jgi:TetR/AcrR family transcriptional repressor of nem operon
MARPSSKAALLDAGRLLIHRQGYAASGVAEITAAAGVPKGSFYNHFPSKEAFALAALDSYWEATAPAFAALRGPAPAPARLAAHFAAIKAAMATTQFACGCLLGNLAGEAGAISEPIRARAATLFDLWTDALAACLAEGQDAGTVTQALAAPTLARFLIGAWEGAVLRAKVERDERAFDAFTLVSGRLLAG